MPLHLDDVEARILGSLVEKSLTTPEHYPLSFNALLNACNQKSSRDPVMSIDTDQLGRGITSLLDKNLIQRRAGSRVPKFSHTIETLLKGDNPEIIATIAILMLRGPQTPGEIKTRSERLCSFESTGAVDGLLQDLSTLADGPIVSRLPRKSGQKETRYRQLFTGDDTEETTPPPIPAASSDPAEDRYQALEKRVQSLEALTKELAARIDGG